MINNLDISKVLVVKGWLQIRRELQKGRLIVTSTFEIWTWTLCLASEVGWGTCLWHLCLGFWLLVPSSGNLDPESVLSPPVSSKLSKKWFTKWNQIHPLHQGKAEKIVTYYRHITDNGEIVLRQPLARPGFEEVGRDELAEAPGIRFGLNQDGFWSLFRNSIIAIGAKMTNKLLIVCWILCVELSVNEKSMDSKKASIYRPQSSP